MICYLQNFSSIPTAKYNFSKIILCSYIEVLHNFDNFYRKSQDYNQDNHVV